jgi:hypothetical protein
MLRLCDGCVPIRLEMDGTGLSHNRCYIFVITENRHLYERFQALLQSRAIAAPSSIACSPAAG